MGASRHCRHSLQRVRPGNCPGRTHGRARRDLRRVRARQSRLTLPARSVIVGLGLMVGAVLQPAGAQVRDTVPRRDSVTRTDTIMTARDSARARLKAHADSVARRDSIIRADSIKPGIAQSELPVQADPAGNYHWTRKDMFSGGAIDVMDLLERIPGLVGLHSSWIAQP